MKITVPFIKAMYRLNYLRNDRRLKKAPNPAPYRPRLNVRYGEGGARVFDLFFAPEDVRRRTLLILVHGGYYVRGRHKDSYPFALGFLREGFDVISVEYRLNGGGITTADGLSDVAEFMRYLFSHLEDLGLADEERFFISGDSAGGHYALFIAETYGGAETGLDLGAARLDGVLLNCPSYDYAAYRTVGNMSRAMRRWFLGDRYGEEGYLERVSPRTYISSLTVPAFVSTCRNDFLREGVLYLRDDLEKFGKKHVFVDIGEDDRKVTHVHNVTDPGLPASVRVNRAMIDFMKGDF